MKHFLFICLTSLILYRANGSRSCDVTIVSRDEWGARGPRFADTMVMPAKHIFIHHTETQSCTSLASCARLMRSIQNYHMDNKGWDDIGYNFLIGGDSRVYTGRGWFRKGAHTFGYNHNSIAFSFIGNFTKDPPPQNMWQNAKNMIECAINETHVTDNYKLHGHRDASCTDCPGQALYDMIKTWANFQGGPLPAYFCRSG